MSMSQPFMKSEKDAPRYPQPDRCMGAVVTDEGTRFTVWAPKAQNLHVVLGGDDEHPSQRIPCEGVEGGWFEALIPAARHGMLYKFQLDDGLALPDPASRWQPQGPHGPSMIVDSGKFKWGDTDWTRPPMRDLVLYELHIGTFTPEGTFRSAIQKLPHLKALGVNAIELMPVAEWAGMRNWGYDGVCLFAPAHAYGEPDDLRALVEAAHFQGIAVILDVVYNHFGPDGNYFAHFVGDYLDESSKTPWGGAVRYGDPAFAALRETLVCNVEYWMDAFHIDGFRLDATHAIHDESNVHILQEVTGAIHAKDCYAIAEDSRNDASLCEPRGSGGMGFDAVWADDFHHVLRVGQTQESVGYYGDYAGSTKELCEILRSGWWYQGQTRRSKAKAAGSPCLQLPPTCFVVCISNHDQIGNRAFGERLHQCTSMQAYRALSALLCLAPFTPMIFMGQEWAASSPFLFFTDHNQELGRLVTEGRRREFAAFPQFADEAARETIPDPQSVATFLSSKLRWDEIATDPHQGVLSLYQACLALRRTIPLLNAKARRGWRVELLPQDLVVVHYDGEASGHSMIVYLNSEPAVLPLAEVCRQPSARAILSSEEKRFGGRRQNLDEQNHEVLHLQGPELIVVEW